MTPPPDSSQGSLNKDEKSQRSRWQKRIDQKDSGKSGIVLPALWGKGLVVPSGCDELATTLREDWNGLSDTFRDCMISSMLDSALRQGVISKPGMFGGAGDNDGWKQIGGLWFRKEPRIIRVGSPEGKLFNVRSMGTKLLYHLADNLCQVVTYDDLGKLLGALPGKHTTHTLQTTIYEVKLELKRENLLWMIVNERGVGYAIVDRRDAQII